MFLFSAAVLIGSTCTETYEGSFRLVFMIGERESPARGLNGCESMQQALSVSQILRKSKYTEGEE